MVVVMVLWLRRVVVEVVLTSTYGLNDNEALDCALS